MSSQRAGGLSSDFEIFFFFFVFGVLFFISTRVTDLLLKIIRSRGRGTLAEVDGATKSVLVSSAITISSSSSSSFQPVFVHVLMF